MVMATGAFVRSKFTDGYFDELAYIKPTPMVSYLVKASSGEIEGEVTIFKRSDNSAKVVDFRKGEVTKVISEYKN